MHLTTENKLHIIPEVFHLHNIILWFNKDHMFPFCLVLLRSIMWQQRKTRNFFTGTWRRRERTNRSIEGPTLESEVKQVISWSYVGIFGPNSTRSSSDQMSAAYQPQAYFISLPPHLFLGGPSKAPENGFRQQADDRSPKQKAHLKNKNPKSSQTVQMTPKRFHNPSYQSSFKCQVQTISSMAFSM